MTNTERNKRLAQTIKETESSLSKAVKTYNDSIICLKMEVEENKELGNPIECNFLRVKHSNECKARVTELKEHIEYLKNMMV